MQGGTHCHAIGGGTQQGSVKVEVGGLNDTALIAGAGRGQENGHGQQVCSAQLLFPSEMQCIFHTHS